MDLDMVYEFYSVFEHGRFIAQKSLHPPGFRSFATRVSQLKICDFSGENFKSCEVLQFSMSATTTQLLSSGEFCKLRYGTIPVKSTSADASICTSNSKMSNFKL